ncbi:hypothetical protein C8Q72DRAFT_8669 [Fomitopsis betulina]|nr:hypothetical protein C8Q72DRAFT_8669 [Fomitopsis betulina]
MRRPLRREAIVSLQPPVSTPGREAQAGPSRQHLQAQAGTSRVHVQAQAGTSRVHVQAQAGPSQPRMQGTSARIPTGPPPKAPVMRMRDPTDRRFFMPLPPTEGEPPSRQVNAPRLQRSLPSRGSSGLHSVVRRPHQPPSMVAKARDRILEVAESLGPLPRVTQGTSDQPAFARPPLDAEIATTANNDEAEPISLSLDISSSDPAEEIVEEGGNVHVLPDHADRDSEDEADEAEDGADKGKVRATDDEDDAGCDFWTVWGGFAAHELLEMDPSQLEDSIDAMLKVLEERARKHPRVAAPVQDWPAPIVGCSREEMLEMCESHLSRAEQLDQAHEATDALQPRVPPRSSVTHPRAEARNAFEAHRPRRDLANACEGIQSQAGCPEAFARRRRRRGSR